LSPKYLFSLRRPRDPVLEKRQSGDDRRPYAETKEQLGGIQILEARDLNYAVQLVSQQPGFKYGLGPIEIRPVMGLSEIIKESEQRRERTRHVESEPSGRMTSIRGDVTSAAEAGRFISFTAGLLPVDLKTCSTPPWDTVILKAFRPS
jgi:hypothetical protein